MGTSRLCCCDDLCFVAAGHAAHDIIADRSAKQKGYLTYIGDVGSERPSGHVGNIAPVDRYGSLVRSIEPEQQIQDGGLPATRSSDQSCDPPGFGDERYASQHGFAGAIRESHVGKLD